MHSLDSIIGTDSWDKWHNHDTTKSLLRFLVLVSIAALVALHRSGHEIPTCLKVLYPTVSKLSRSLCEPSEQSSVSEMNYSTVEPAGDSLCVNTNAPLSTAWFTRQCQVLQYEKLRIITMVRFTTKDDLNLARWQQARPTANVFDACRKEVVCCFYVLKLGMNNPRKIEHSWTKNLRVFQFWFQTPKTNHENTIIISSTIFMFEILTAKYFVRVPAKPFVANVFQFFHSLDWLYLHNTIVVGP